MQAFSLHAQINFGCEAWVFIKDSFIIGTGKYLKSPNKEGTYILPIIVQNCFM